MNDAIEAINLTKYYDNILAVDHISFEVKRGEIFGFLGPNGAGKTTTIRLLTGQAKPNSGRAIIAGFDMARESIKAKGLIGVVPELSNLYDELSVWDNIIFAAQLYGVPRDVRGTRARELLELIGLYDRRGDRVGNLSKGMRRRLTIAAALIHEPDILFLDEPTSGLDVQSARAIRALIKELNEKDMTVFLTTHYIEEADQLCDRIAIINKGRIVAEGKPEELKSRAKGRVALDISFGPRGIPRDGLATLEHVKEVSKFGDVFRVYVDDITGFLKALADLAQRSGLEITSISTVKSSLEDAFVRITGLSPESMRVEKEPARGRGDVG
ncbi:MAG: ATP-binding cassette domain-containing protein [Candidatus Bathyarchaeia archaeon]